MTKKFDVIEWMYTNGHPGYKNEINDLKVRIEELKAEALNNCNKTFYVAGLMKTIKEKEAEIERVRREAQDRYDDWVSDLDYC